MMRLADDFTNGLNRWHVLETGSGRVEVVDGRLHLIDRPTSGGEYTNAQISDYSYQTFHMRWRPPVRLAVRAYAMGGPAVGTAGFGFWNHPLSPDQKRRLPRLPKAIWFFFAAPPSDLRLAYGVPGSGWQASTVDLTRPRALALAPFAPLAVLLMQWRPFYRWLWPRLQPALCISTGALGDELLSEAHTYVLDWRSDSATFSVDGQVVHEAPVAPSGGMGFIAWIDNQYAIVTPRGRFGWGLKPVVQEQRLVIERIEIDG
ncbi:MAG: hypothetical protein DIU68_006315 [Chloroflexota bacterium]